MIPISETLIQAVGLAFIGFSTALLALVVMARRLTSDRKPATQKPTNLVFLFDDGLLVDASESAKNLFDVTQAEGDDLSRLIKLLSPQFPELGAIMAETGPAAQMTSTDGHATLRIKQDVRFLRLELQSQGNSNSSGETNSFMLSTMNEELAMCRGIADNTPFPVWRQSSSGGVIWSNNAYQKLAKQLVPGLTSGPGTKPLFAIENMPKDSAKRPLRMELKLPQETDPKWFEFQVNDLGTDKLITAFPVDRVVQAERSLKDFVQTLTQTFAHLNVGLAVFNRSRELALFNPALTDLLALSPEFLIRRPTLFEMFDRLREKRLMPEPKNYNTWLQQMSALEAAAADGVYSETWSLVDGRTYRISGRPHPEGAVAFLFEDISAEITLKRTFKSELQISQSVLDGLPEAIAVFSPSGTRLLFNRRYEQLWLDVSGPEAELHSLDEDARLWKQKCAPTPVWSDVQDFAATMGERQNWTSEVRMRNGRSLICRFEALPGGCTQVGFTEQAKVVTNTINRENAAISA